MPDLSFIKNPKLRALLEASHKFNALPKDKQLEHIERIKNLPKEKQEEIYIFLEKENREEQKQQLTNEEKLEILNGLYNELVEMEQKFTKLLKKETENKERQKDAEKTSQLLSNLQSN